MFYLTTHLTHFLFTVKWRQTYGNPMFGEQGPECTVTQSDSRIGCSPPNSMLSGRRSRCTQLLIQHFYKIFNGIGDMCDRERERERERERNVLFNDALNTFYLQLYGFRHMVKDHSDSEKGNPLPPHRLLLSINSKGSFICTIPQTG